MRISTVALSEHEAEIWQSLLMLLRTDNFTLYAYILQVDISTFKIHVQEASLMLYMLIALIMIF